MVKHPTFKPTKQEPQLFFAHHQRRVLLHPLLVKRALCTFLLQLVIRRSGLRACAPCGTLFRGLGFLHHNRRRSARTGQQENGNVDRLPALFVGVLCVSCPRVRVWYLRSSTPQGAGVCV